VVRELTQAHPGNCFDSQDRRLAHAMDCGEQKSKSIAWDTNAVHIARESHVGVLSVQADRQPFAAI